MKVGERLGLDPLCCINEKYRALNRDERPGNFVREIDVARGINQIQHHAVPHHPHRLHFNGDPALPLKFHLIEILLAHF